jgi:phage baseplate assembly protein V
LIGEVRALMGRWQRKVALMVARGIVQYVEDEHGLQQINLLVTAGDLWSEVQRFQEYGFTSSPLPGAEAIVCAIGGLRSFGAIVATDDRRYRLQTLPKGGVALYDAHGSTVVLDNAGDITATGTGIITATAPTVVVNASVKVHMATPLLEVTGDIIDNVGTNAHTMANTRTIFNGHFHGGVQAGAANTNTPNQTM